MKFYKKDLNIIKNKFFLLNKSYNDMSKLTNSKINFIKKHS